MGEDNLICNKKANLTIGPHALDGRVLNAPMAGISDQPYRNIARHYDASLAVTEMVSVDPELLSSRKSRLRLNHDGEKKPVSVQILGADPEKMADAARYNVDNGAQIIDINLGCPAKKVCKKLVGSALMKDEGLVQRILESVTSAVEVPVTLKMRTGWDLQNRNALKIASIAENSGIKALAIHGRTRQCMYKGPIDYQTIAKVKNNTSIPIIANGDITTPEEAFNVLQITRADAVMIGRAAQGQPWLLARINCYLKNGIDPGDPPLSEKLDIIFNHLENLYVFYGNHQGILIARKHIKWYFERLGIVNSIRQRFNSMATPNDQIMMIRDIFNLSGYKNV